MAHEQREKILQILHDQHYEHPHTLDREDLARLMEKRLPEIQEDIQFLKEKGYIVINRIQRSGRIFHRLGITPSGIESIKGEKQPLRRLEVFISSPSDVYEERQIVKRVIERCNRLHSIAERYVLRALDYEERVPAEVGKKPQAIVDSHMRKASDSDLFICLFWHRMGTPVTDEETGEHFQSGTEYEFLNAYRHNQMHGKPYILLYRAMKPFPPEVDLQQLRAVESFFKRFEGEHAEFKGLYKTYVRNEAFENTLLYDLDTVLSNHLFL